MFIYFDKIPMKKIYKDESMENEFTLITIFVLALSFYINLCYKRNQYRKYVFNNLIYKKNLK